jgi:predicted ArsR family transcriptional regulator
LFRLDRNFDFFCYILPRRVASDLTARQRRILSLLADHGEMALREFRQRLAAGVENWAIKEDLALLKSLGLVDSGGYGRGARWYLPDEIEEYKHCQFLQFTVNAPANGRNA